LSTMQTKHLQSVINLWRKLSSQDLLPGLSLKMNRALLTSHLLAIPMITDVPSAFFCELYQEIELKGSKTIPLIVEIKAQFIDDAIISDKEKITLDFSPLARVGKSYTLLGKNITPPTIK